MEWVTMRHDGVDGEIRVAQSAVPSQLNAGWSIVEPPEPEPEAPEDATADEQPAAEGKKTTRRRAGSNDNSETGE